MILLVYVGFNGTFVVTFYLLSKIIALKCVNTKHPPIKK